MKDQAPPRGNPLVRKLELFAALSEADQHALEVATSLRVRRLLPQEDVVREGDRPSSVDVILAGWACRYKHLEDGRRQVLGYLLPGDLCDLNMFVLQYVDYSIAALTPLRIAEVPRDMVLEMMDGGSSLSRALWWSAMAAEAIEREWIVNLGQRTAFERLGHLLCELFLRQEAIGLTDDNSCDMPLTQSDLADTMGLSTVHVNRTLQELRGQNLIVLKSKVLTILDLKRLKRACLFSDTYLHLYAGALASTDIA